MKKLFSFSLLFLFSVVFFACNAVPGSGSSANQKELDAYDTSTLSRNTLPVLMPYNKIVAPAGKQIYFGNPALENHALDCAVSPNGKFLAVEGRYRIVIISTADNRVLSEIALPKKPGFKKFVNTMSGIRWSRDSQNLFWSADDKRHASAVLSATVNKNGRAGLNSDLRFKGQKKTDGHFLTAIPNELLITRKALFVVLNGNNQLLKINFAQIDKPVWQATTGVAPFGLTKASGKLYVSNWGGRQPKDGELTAGTPWDPAVVDAKKGDVNNGTVSVFSPKTGRLIKEIKVGLHPNDIIAAPDGRFVYVANGNSDNVSVIDAQNDKVTETINVRLMQGKKDFVGDSPNGLALSPDGRTLYVANGMDNALAVIALGKNSCTNATQSKSMLTGFIPTGAYPGNVAVSADGRMLYVANIEGMGARATIPKNQENKAFYTFHHWGGQKKVNGAFSAHRQLAMVSAIPVPDAKQLTLYTQKVQKNNRAFHAQLSSLLPRKNRKPQPMPERIGEPSVFKHVLYIIKENRTYDQVLGDMKQGDGDPELCSFGRDVTPNIHQLALDYVLLDNYYASGKSSSEGHQWTDAGMVTDYIEKKVRGWFRSYDHVQYDAMVYPAYGFLWNNALAHGKRVRIYGEAAHSLWDHTQFPDWTSIYTDYKNGDNRFTFKNVTTIEPIRSILAPRFPAYDHKISDVFRAQRFIEELHHYEQLPGDSLPQLMIMALPSDHTSGTRPEYPTPRAMVADNDLGLARIIEALSHSRFWKNTVVFVTEDDSQDGWDHVSAYRTVGLVLSPYSHLKKTVHTNFNNTSMLRSIEQILGLPPMNQIDAAARPMFECFTTQPDLTPYKALPNRIALDEMNKPLRALHGEALKYARLSLQPQFDEVDAGDEDTLNRILWFATMNGKPYPARFADED